MKTFKLLVLTIIFLFGFYSFSQDQFTVEIEPLAITNAPSIHSFSWGITSDNKWVVIGGRIDGLHRRQPWAAFQESDNNTQVFVIDPIANETWSADLSILSSSIFEQLQSTNQNFIQRNNTLYIVGGYGYSATQNDHITFPNLTAIDVDNLALAIINGNLITSFFRQISDVNLAVTGGQLGLLNDVFYLCGGQYFEGRYNPQGPDFGPGFIQQYTDAIRKFEIIDDGSSLSIANYSAQNDLANLHRRDYNMSPQIFPNGDYGFTMFSGVFQHDVDLPWLNTVDVTETNYTVNNSFNQLLSQYHSAKVPLYDANTNVMHTLFFGGMSQFKLDANNNLIQDDNVPFVKTISKVSRFSDGSMTESSLNIEMPTLLGSGAEFIPFDQSTYYLTQEIINLNNLPVGETLVGYIFGGIESSQENIFFINDGTQSTASNLAFKVFINKNTLTTNEFELDAENSFNLSISPNPSFDKISIDCYLPSTNPFIVKIEDLLGKTVSTINLDKKIGQQKTEIDISNLASGEYFVSLFSGTLKMTKKIIKN